LVCALAAAITTAASAQVYETTAALTISGSAVTANVTAFVPETAGDATLRGVIVWSNGSGEDRRHMARVPWAQTFARVHGYALVALNASPFSESDATLTANNLASLLAAVSTASGRAGIVNAPVLAAGMSFGGIHSSTLAAQFPARVLGFAANKGLYGANIAGFNTALAGQVIGIALPGEDDGNGTANAFNVQTYFADWRALDAATGRIAYALDYNTGHNDSGNQSWDLALVLLAEADRLRHPGTALTAGQPALVTVPYASGWLAERATVSAGTPSPVTSRPTFPQIASVARFNGPAGTASWLPSERAARAYRAFTSTEAVDTNRTEIPKQNALQIETPARFQQFIPGDDVVVTVDAREWKSATSMTLFLDGAPISTLTAPPWRWTLSAPPAGHHSAVVEASDGTVQRAAFVTFSVLGLPATANTWTGTAANNQLHATANWSAGAPSTLQFPRALLDGAAANNQFTVSNASSASDPVFWGLEFATAPGANGFTLAGWRHTYIGFGGIRNLDDSTQTISQTGDLRLSAPQTWAALAGDLAIAAPVNLGTPDLPLFNRFGELTLLTAAGRSVTLDGAIKNHGSLLKDGPGLAVLNAVNTFSDARYAWDPATRETVRVHGGVLRLGPAATLAKDSARVFIAEIPGATLDLAGRAVAIASLHGGGTVELGAGGSIDLQAKYEESAQHSFAPTDFRGTIRGGTSGQTSLTVRSAYTWYDSDGNSSMPAAGTFSPVLSGSSDYLGQTLVANGTLRVAGSTALGATGAGNETLVPAGSVLALAGSGLVVPEDFIFNTAANTVALTNAAGSGSNTLTGVLRLPTVESAASNLDALLHNEAAGTTLTLAGLVTGQNWTAAGSGKTRVFLRGATNARFDITGTLANASNGSLTVFTQKIGATPTNPVFRFAAINPFTGAFFHLGGTLVLAADAPSGAPGALGNSTSAVTLGASWGTANTESIAVLAEGARTIGRPFWISTYAGWNATATFGQADAASSLWTGSITTNQLPLVLTAAAGGTATFQGTISDGSLSLPVQKTGSGRVILTAANAYDGGTTVAEGTLLLANTSGSATGTGAISVSSGAALGGTGTASGAVTFASGARLVANLVSAPAAHDRLDIGGALTLAGTSIELSADGGAPSAGTYTLVQAASITGTPGSVIAPAGMSASAAVVGNQLQVTLSLTAEASWRQLWFGSTLDTGLAADSADPDGDGVTNATERALGTDPLLPGAPASALPSDLPARLVSLNPEADNHVRSENPNTAYATGNLVINNGANQREAFLRYNLAGLTGTLERALLVFWIRTTDSATPLMHVQQLADSADDWSETGLTWNSKPTSLAGNALTFTGPFVNGTQRVLDVTAMVADTLASDPARKLGLRVFASGTMGVDIEIGDNTAGSFRRAYLHLTFRASSAAPLRVLHIGDSITRGAAGGVMTNTFSDAGWRYYLHNLLLAQKLDFRAVGPRMQDGSIAGYENSSSPAAELDRPLLFQANAGYSGQGINFVRDNIAGWLAASPADLITLMVGTNDVGYASSSAIPQATLDTAKANYTALLNNLFAAAPSAKVVLATIPPVGGNFAAANVARIEPFNAQVVRALHTEFSATHPGRIFLVDNYAALAPADIGSDGIHPRSAGHQKLARAWHAGISRALGGRAEARFINEGAGADAPLRGGVNADTAFGGATTPLVPAWTNTLLRSRAALTADSRAKSVLKFDLGNLPEQVDAATVGLVYHGTTTSGGIATAPVVVHLYGIGAPTQNWTKQSVTWNSAPGHNPATDGVLPTATIYLASASIPAGSRTGDLVTFSSDALAAFLNGVGSESLASFVLVAAGRTSAEAVFGSSTQGDYQPPFLLVSAAPADGLGSFRSAYGLPADGSQDLATPAGDGVPNLLKYAFNLLGTAPGQKPALAVPNSAVLAADGSAGLPRIALESGATRLSVTYVRRKASTAAGITYAVEFSSTLSSAPGAGFGVNASASETVVSLDDTWERVTVTDSVAPAPQRFARVRVATLP
jgi:autotransporter-associated beta strand protein